MKENVVPMSEFRYYLLYKPIGIISQHFSDVKKKKTLRDVHLFAEGVQPLGRLDEDSEGLLLLTDDKVFTTTLSTTKAWRKNTGCKWWAW